jgi:hypothetical protein
VAGVVDVAPGGSTAITKPNLLPARATNLSVVVSSTAQDEVANVQVRTRVCRRPPPRSVY